MLRVEKLNAGYGDIQVLWDISMQVDIGQTVALIGPNGAGKSTLLNCICGLLPAESGKISLEDKDITSIPPHERTKRGIIQIPEGRKLFAAMTVIDNLVLGAYTRTDKEQVSKDLDWVLELFPELVTCKDRLAGSLSGGQQQMAAIARGLMSKPRYLLIDEMSLGVAPVIVDRLSKAIRDIQATGNMGILVVEQDVVLALELASYAYVLETGRLVREGEASLLASDPRIMEAYLGIG